jgi:pilus assembly protein CpaE
VPASTVLLLSTDPASAETVTGILTGVGYVVTSVADPGEAFHRAAEHQLVILDVVEGERTAADVCREIRGTPAMAAIPVLCVAKSDDVEERIHFLEAGADDVMARPFDGRELEARVEALLLRFQRSKDMSPVVAGESVMLAPRTRRIVAVFSPKGGVGTTTIATNIAMVQARAKPDKVAIVDMHLQFGQVATHLNLELKQSLVELVRDEAALREAELLRTYAMRHDSGLHVIAAPPTPELAELVQPRHVEAILETILDSYEAVVVDAGSTLDERTMAVLEKADAIVLPVHPEIAALKTVHSLLDYLNEAGSAAAKMTFVLNLAFAREILRLRDVESALGTKIGAELPYDPFLYLKAVNEGVPVVVGAPRSAPAERLTKLSEAAFGGPLAALAAEAASPTPSARKPRGLTGLLRRS